MKLKRIHMEILNDAEKQGKIISVKEWIAYLLILCIPIVNIVCLIMWAFGTGDTNLTRKNWAKAQILIVLFLLILVFLIFLFADLCGITMLSGV